MICRIELNSTPNTSSYGRVLISYDVGLTLCHHPLFQPSRDITCIVKTWRYYCHDYGILMQLMCLIELKPVYTLAPD